jgi:malate synthase
VTSADLLDFSPSGPITEGGVRTNVVVALRYLSSWLGGTGCVPINDLMEDAATAEISRSQLWQWTRSPRGMLDDGRAIDEALVLSMVHEARDELSSVVADPTHLDDAAKLLEDLLTAAVFPEFLTLAAYDLID